MAQIQKLISARWYGKRAGSEVPELFEGSPERPVLVLLDDTNIKGEPRKWPPFITDAPPPVPADEHPGLSKRSAPLNAATPVTPSPVAAGDKPEQPKKGRASDR